MRAPVYILRFLLSLAFFATTLRPCHAANSLLLGLDKLSSNHITNICQDHYDYIWIATQYGLNRYDGYNFTTYLKGSSPGSLPSNDITWVQECGRGRLLVSTASGLARYDYATDTFTPIRLAGRFEGGRQPSFSRVVADSRGNLYIGTSGAGLFFLKWGRDVAGRIHRFSKDGDDDYFQKVFIDRRGRLWKQGGDNVVSCYAMSGPRSRLLFKERIGLNLCKKIVEMHHGTMAPSPPTTATTASWAAASPSPSLWAMDI